MDRTRTALFALAAPLLAAPALAQSNVDPANKFSWSENCGWMNWADAGSPTGQQGAVVHASYLSGFIWCENLGWVNLGNGSPTDDCDGHPCYSTSNGPDTGVNLDPATGDLSGLAWSENAGWVNFSGGALATPPIPARLDFSAGRLRGYAWGENVGWINLDDAAHFVGVTLPPACDPDLNQDGNVDQDDIAYLINVIGGGANPTGIDPDFNHDGNADQDDIGALINVIAGGQCP